MFMNSRAHVRSVAPVPVGTAAASDSRPLRLAPRRGSGPGGAAVELERRMPRRLPAQPRRLIGREAGQDRIRELLLQPPPSGLRLITLSGPGGVGKTRLAVAVASDMSERYADGAFFVDLSPLNDPRLVLPTVA